MDNKAAATLAEGAVAREMGDLLVDYLLELGVDHVFGIPGGAIEPFVDALARRGSPRCVITRHETGSAFMAEGYYAATGKLGVCFATTGPGVTNLVTGVAYAYANYCPMLIISAQTALPNLGRGAFQESSCTGINVLAMLEPITRYNSLVSHPDQLAPKLAAAAMRAHHHPRGPVHLSLPIDVLRVRGQGPRSLGLSAAAVREREVIDEKALDRFRNLLAVSRCPVFVLGSGAAEGIDSILNIAETLNIPLVATPEGCGLVDAGHRLYRGVIGFAGHRSAVEALTDQRVDLVVVIGSALSEWLSNGWDEATLLNERLVHVDCNPDHLQGSPMARLQVFGSIGRIFERLSGLLDNFRPQVHAVVGATRGGRPRKGAFAVDDPAATRSDRQPLLPQRLMTLLPEVFPAGTHFVADTGNSFAWAIHYLHPRRPRDTGSLLRVCPEFAPMGWAIGSALGLSFAHPDRAVVCITGDGSFLMSGQEITVALEHCLPVFFVILNDGAYGMVKHGQRQTGAEAFGYGLPIVDYAAMARAMGIRGETIRCSQDLLALDMAALAAERQPVLLDVLVDGEAGPPMSLRARTLKGPGR